MNGSEFTVAVILSLVIAEAAMAGTGIPTKPTEALKAEYMFKIMENARDGAWQALSKLQSRSVTVPVDLNTTYCGAMDMYDLALQYRSQETTRSTLPWTLGSSSMLAGALPWPVLDAPLGYSSFSGGISVRALVATEVAVAYSYP